VIKNGAKKLSQKHRKIDDLIFDDPKVYFSCFFGKSMFLWGARGPSFGHNFDFDSSPVEEVMPNIGSRKQS